MQCNSCFEEIHEFSMFKRLGGDKFECEGCSDKTLCMYCKQLEGVNRIRDALTTGTYAKRAVMDLDVQSVKA